MLHASSAPHHLLSIITEYRTAISTHFDTASHTSSSTAIITQVTNGKNAMPAFGGRLDDDEITDVAAYVYDQATNAKWD
jgi:Cytochrome C oxidase, cbb3-type, subunit III